MATSRPAKQPEKPSPGNPVIPADIDADDPILAMLAAAEAEWEQERAKPLEQAK